MKFSAFIFAAAGGVFFPYNIATANISDDSIRLGVIVDMTGTFSAFGGRGMIKAVEMAIKDVGGEINGKEIKLITGDYRNKVDIAASKVREWIDVDKVDIILEATDSASSIAMQKIALEKKKPIIFIGSASASLTNEHCSPYGIHWAYDTYSLATGTGHAITSEGNKSWYFLTADYAFGHTLQKDTENVVKKEGGEILGASRHPLNTHDFASFLMTAQSSGAKVIGLANSGKDAQNAIRQANEFAMNSTNIIAPLLIFETDIRGLGLDVAQGMYFTTGFYWDRNQETRDFSQKFYEIHGGMPSMVQAGAYSAVMHYFNAIKNIDSDQAEAVLKEMKSTPVNDFFAKNGIVREDGRMVHDMYLAKVKSPKDSTGEWDIAEIIQTIPGKDAYMSLEESTCKLIN